MLSLKRLLGVVLVAFAVLPAIAADEQPAAADQTAQIAKWVEQLDADEFSQRQAASEKLFGIGKPAIDALSKAAAGESLEVTSRAVEILKKLHQSEDEATKKAAQAALEALAKGSHAPSARRAKEVLKITDAKGPAADPNVPGGIILGGGGIQIIQGNIQIGGGAKGKKISVKVKDGVKEIEVDEGDKKYRIVEEPNKGIKVEITTKKDGKDVTEKIEAKDAEDLKKKSKAAYEIYNEYGKNAAGGAIQVQIGGGAVPVPAIARPRRRQIDTVKLVLKSMGQSLEGMTTEEELKAASQETRDELKKGIDELKTQIADLEKRLKAADKPAEKGDKPAAEKPADKPVEKVEAKVEIKASE